MKSKDIVNDIENSQECLGANMLQNTEIEFGLF